MRSAVNWLTNNEYAFSYSKLQRGGCYRLVDHIRKHSKVPKKATLVALKVN